MSNKLDLSIIVDFYVLEAVKYRLAFMDRIPMSQTRFAIWEQTAQKFVRNLSDALASYVFMACLGEARHARSHVEGGWIPSEIPAYYDRNDIYTWAVDYAIDHKNVDSLVECFDQDWNSGAYGGRAWRKIAESLHLYLKGQDDPRYLGVFIDHLVDLQHNGGNLFDKSGAMRLAGLISHAMDDDSIQKFLNWKATTEDIFNDSKTKFWLNRYASTSMVAFCKQLVRLPIVGNPELSSGFSFRAREFGVEFIGHLERQYNSCCNCGALIDEDDTCSVGDGCTECQEQCKECLDWQSPSYMIGEYCEHCYSQLDTCEECEEVIEDSDDVVWHNDKTYCPDCAGYHLHRCKVCGCIESDSEKDDAWYNDETPQKIGDDICLECASEYGMCWCGVYGCTKHIMVELKAKFANVPMAIYYTTKV